jgi:hypothetical protein
LQVVTSPCCPRQLPDVISNSLFLDAGSPTPAVHRVLAPVSSTVPSAFPKGKWVGFPQLSRLKRLRAGEDFRGCRYFVMFRPPSLLAPQIVPTAANTPAGQPGLLRPSRTRFVASPRIGYANRPKTGNWRCGDLHPARLRPCRLLLSSIPPIIPYGGFSPVRLEGWRIRRDLPGSSISLSLLPACTDRRPVCLRPSCTSWPLRESRSVSGRGLDNAPPWRSLLLRLGGPRSGSGYSVPNRHHLIGPIRPTRRHIAISPHGGLYAMPSLCGSA